MGKRGPKPTPLSRRLRQGGTRGQGKASHRPLPNPALVVVGGRDIPVEPPEDLPEAARALWSQVVPALAPAGVLDRVDLPMLRLFCLEYARGVQAASVVDAEPDEAADAELEGRLTDSRAIVRAQKVVIARQLRAGVDVSPAKLAAVQNLEAVVANLEAYRDARRRVGNLVALGSTGQLVAHPLVDVERASSSVAMAFAARFGLTPADRVALGLQLLEGHSRARDVESVLGRARQASLVARADASRTSTNASPGPRDGRSIGSRRVSQRSPNRASSSSPARTMAFDSSPPSVDAVFML